MAKGRGQAQKYVKKKMFDGPAELPVNTAPSNETGDRLAMATTIGLLILSGLICGSGIYFSTVRFLQAVTSSPIDYVSCVLMTGLLFISLLVSRNLLWLSFFGTVMLSAKMGAWKSLEGTSRRALKFHKYLPNGSAWASLALTQSLAGRGLYKEAIKHADEEWERSGENPNQAHNMGPICVTAAISHQTEGDMAKTILWNERAIATLNKSLEDMTKPKKGLMAWAQAPQSEQMIGQLRLQLAGAYFNLATLQFNNQDHRRAKENYKKAVENAHKAPDFPQKSDILKYAGEQLARLKHA